MRYVALDPGGTTGVASAVLRDGRVVLFEAGQLPPLEAVDWAYARVYGAPSVIVCERYTITQHSIKMSRQNDALEVIGAMRWIAKCVNAEFTLQDPSVAKRQVSNDTLRRNDMWSRAQEHANDATRHLIVALVRAGCYDLLLDG